jgi:hypothetical protein
MTRVNCGGEDQCLAIDNDEELREITDLSADVDFKKWSTTRSTFSTTRDTISCSKRRRRERNQHSM